MNTRPRCGSTAPISTAPSRESLPKAVSVDTPDRPCSTIDAFSRFYDEHAEALLVWFARRTLDPGLAAELTAETFAEAFQHRGRIEDRGDAGGAWLYGVARHKLAHYYRRGRVEDRARRRLALSTPALSADDFERIETLAEIGQTRPLLRTALLALPPDQRKALGYRVVEDLDYAEVGSRLGCSQESARKLVSRRHHALRNALRVVPEV